MVTERLEPIDDPEVAGQSVLALAEQVKRLRENIRRLLDQVGDRRPCRGATCKAIIWYVRLKTGKVAPYTADALNHFADCPDAAAFKKRKEPDHG